MTSNVYIPGLDSETQYHAERIIAIIKSQSQDSIHDVRQHLANNISQWKDELGLNLIHYSICFHRPDVLLMLLSKSEIFSTEHEPDVSPYAHLAAVVGAPACLDVILTLRPHDYFESYLPKHIVVVPAEFKTTFPKLHNVLVRDLQFSRPENNYQINAYRQQCRQKSMRQAFNQLPERANIRAVTRKIMVIRDWKPTSLSDISSLDTLKKSSVHLNRVESGPKLPSIYSGSSKKSLLRSSVTKDNYNLNLPVVKIKEPTASSIAPTRKPSDELDQLQESIEHAQNIRKFMFKTPIQLAAERNHSECVKTILLMRTLAHNRYLSGKGYVVLAAKEACPDAINFIIKEEVADRDIIDAMALVTSELIIESVIPVLREIRRKHDVRLFNLFNAVFKASLKLKISSLDNLTNMIKLLIDENEDINNSEHPGTYALYTLIENCFITKSNDKFSIFLQCFKILLDNKVNLFFDEILLFEDEMNKKQSKNKAYRNLYSSYLHCIFSYIDNIPDKTTRSNHMKLRLRRILEVIKYYKYDMGHISALQCQSLLFQYLRNPFVFGVDTTVLVFILNLKVDTDVKEDGRYALNIYFDTLLDSLSLEKRGVRETYDLYKSDIENIILLCRKMSYGCLKHAVRLILDKHLFNRMLHIIPLVRYFCYLVQKVIKSKEICRQWRQKNAKLCITS